MASTGTPGGHEYSNMHMAVTDGCIFSPFPFFFLEDRPHGILFKLAVQLLFAHTQTEKRCGLQQTDHLPDATASTLLGKQFPW